MYHNPIMITTTASQNDLLSHKSHLNYEPYFNKDLNMLSNFSQKNIYKIRDSYANNAGSNHTSFNMY